MTGDDDVNDVHDIDGSNSTSSRQGLNNSSAKGLLSTAVTRSSDDNRTVVDVIRRYSIVIIATN